MNTVHVLDCTLRDGGYCNQWKFGLENVKKITSGLVEAGIDIIECGFLTNTVVYDEDVTKFNTVDQLSKVIPLNKEGKLFVAMMNYGEYDVADLPNHNGSSIDGIRVAFHKRDLDEALDLCKAIQEKGYKVFIQAMISLSYSDEEFLNLINRVNIIYPYSFYIVDSFGMMKGKDLTRLFYMVEHNLDEDIWIGFHSHNNMQLSYSNAQTLVGVKTNRNLIFDSSVYGMGRGAGNLNTELFMEYLNENYDKRYILKPLLVIIDEILDAFYKKNYWGYSLPNYISAKNSAHPNYASFLDDKKTLTVEDMENIFQLMEDEKKVGYDKQYMEELYTQYLATNRVQDTHKEELLEHLKGKKILLIAPGKSSSNERNKILEKMKNKNIVSVSVNFNFEGVKYIFVSNLRRYRELEEGKQSKCIVTSNITSDRAYLQTNYRDLLNIVEAVRDNAGLMAIKFFVECGITEIELAGFDGYSHDSKENYADSQLELITRNAVLDAMNAGMNTVLESLKDKVKITFLTAPKYVKI